jgi:hypothetical protein
MTDESIAALPRISESELAGRECVEDRIADGVHLVGAYGRDAKPMQFFVLR